jgi:DNA-binding response OmpR family regulator
MEESAKAEADGARILVVDDDANLRRLLEVMLSRIGHDPIAVGTLAQARTVDVGSIDLFLCDLHLADGNGMELIARLKSGSGPGRDARFVMVSGDHDPAMIEDVKAVGGVYLAKPFTPEELAAAVDEALAD